MKNHDSGTCDYERFQLLGLGADLQLTRDAGQLHALHGGYGHAGLSTDRQAASPTYTEEASAKCKTAAAQTTKRHEQSVGYAA